MLPPRLQRPRPPGWDTFGGDDPEVHAAMHEALLAELAEEDEAVRPAGEPEEPGEPRP